MRSMPVRRSPSARRISRTPWVLRPTTEISSTGVRTSVPVELISMISCPGVTCSAATGRAVAIGGLQRDHALAAAAMRREILQRRELAVAVLRGGEHVALAAPR